MDPLGRSKSLSTAITESETRLMRSVATGKSSDGSTSIQLTGNGKVKSIDLTAEALGLTDEQAEKVGTAVSQALEAALAKQGRRVRRELSQLG